jgi:hypothetical protein
MPFESLQGTREEGERIAEVLGVEPMLEDEALEAPIKAKRSPRILHLATHGFFLSDLPKEASEEQLGLKDVGEAEVGLLGRLSQAENPFLRSGLALAGANTFLGGGSVPERAQDVTDRRRRDRH